MRKIVALVALTAAAAAAHAAAAKDLVYGTHLSPKHGIMVDAIVPMLEAIEKDTGGSVKWRIAAGGQVVSGRGALAGLRDRLVDGTYIVPAYTRKELAHVNVIFDTAVFGDDAIPASAASSEVILLHCPECIGDFHKQNAVYLAGYAATAFRLMCAKEVRTLADVKGAKVRTVGVGTRLVRAMDGVPVAMSPPAGVTAMQRGAIDCTLGAVSWLQAYGYMDVVKYIVDYPLGIFGGIGLLIMNRDSWRGLSAAEKAAVIKHLPLASARAVLLSYKVRDEQILAAAKAKGIVFTKDQTGFDGVVEKHMAGADAATVAAMQRLGVKDPMKIVKAYKVALEKWRKLAPAIGDDVDKLADALKREIYDKVDPDKL
jgi:TRAP-type C4-dicarboxylate transport system substrate-binding protein